MLCLCLMMISWGSKAWAQNNAYGIDDECYVLFQRAEVLGGTVSDEEFNLVNDSLLHTALAKRDNKAQVLYYGYELVQNYYYNNGKANTAIELLQEMQAYAIEHNDAYGMWYSSRYLVALYLSMSDYISAKPGYVTFSVTDTGPGVPADQAEAIFDRFTKLVFEVPCTQTDK